jgi:hypothetical protein
MVKQAARISGVRFYDTTVTFAWMDSGNHEKTCKQTLVGAESYQSMKHERNHFSKLDIRLVLIRETGTDRNNMFSKCIFS